MISAHEAQSSSVNSDAKSRAATEPSTGYARPLPNQELHHAHYTHRLSRDAPDPHGRLSHRHPRGRPSGRRVLDQAPHTHLALLTHNRQINFRCGLLQQEIPTADGQVRRIAIPALLFRLLPDPMHTILDHYFDSSNPESQALLTRLATQPQLPCYLFNEHNQPQHLFETTNTLQDFLENSLWLMRQAPPSRPDEVALAMALLPQTYPTERHLWDALDTPILSTAIA